MGISNKILAADVAATDNREETLCMVVSLSKETTEEEVRALMERIYAENGTLPLSHQVKKFFFTYDAIMPETAIKVGRKYLLRGIGNGSIRLTPFADFKAEAAEPVKKEPLTGEIADKVRAIIAEGTGKKQEEIDDDAHLMNDLGCDSITYYGILIKVCNEFNIDVEGPVEGKYYTMRDIVTGLATKKEKEGENLF